MPKLISIELNELNFDLIEKYVEDGYLPNFKKLFAAYGYSITQSEAEYENLEPWIQWVSVHTGKTFKEHGLFRLGQIKESSIEQIWEKLERKGVKCGAMSPMNADNRLKQAAFFVPDPWTRARVTGGRFLTSFYNAIAQVVNDNAAEKVSKTSLIYLLLGAIRFASFKNYSTYIQLVLSASKKWNKALFLDLLLADCTIKLTKKNEPEYLTLFLNAAAHVQHHYMFSSRHCIGTGSNPDWYVPKGVDPVLEVYQLYDRIIGQVCQAFPDSRLQLVTGLHQTAYAETTYYWRLRNHDAYLKSLDLQFESVEPRMSRDFLVHCNDATAAEKFSENIKRVRTKEGLSMFKADRTGNDIFVELVFDQEIEDGFTYVFDNQSRADFKDHVAFVAIKNGGHNGDGYFLDTIAKVDSKTAATRKVPLTSLFDITVAAFT